MGIAFNLCHGHQQWGGVRPTFAWRGPTQRSHPKRLQLDHSKWVQKSVLEMVMSSNLPKLRIGHSNTGPVQLYSMYTCSTTIMWWHSLYSCTAVCMYIMYESTTMIMQLLLFSFTLPCYLQLLLVLLLRRAFIISTISLHLVLWAGQSSFWCSAQQ